MKPRQPLSFYKLLQQKEKSGKKRKGQAVQSKPSRIDLETDEVESTPGRVSGPVSLQCACNFVASASVFAFG